MLGAWRVASWASPARPAPASRRTPSGWSPSRPSRRRTCPGTASPSPTSRCAAWVCCFERDLEQPLAGAIAIEPEAELVVTEGNYLLLDRPEWRAVRSALDEVWFLDVPDEVRRPRLVTRHAAYGKTADEAELWVARVDDPNAAMVAATARRPTAWSTPTHPRRAKGPGPGSACEPGPGASGGNAGTGVPSQRVSILPRLLYWPQSARSCDQVTMVP